MLKPANIFLNPVFSPPLHADICPNSEAVITSVLGDGGFEPEIVGDNEGNAVDVLKGSGSFIEICAGDFLLFKPKCPYGAARIIIVQVNVMFVQNVTIALMGAGGNVLAEDTVSVYQIDMIFNMFSFLIFAIIYSDEIVL